MADNIRITGMNELQRKFSNLQRAIRDKRKLYKRIGIKLLNEISQTFRDEAFEGRPWQPLSEKTIESRRSGRGTGAPKILQDTGYMRESMTMDATDKQVKVGTIVKYAPKHHFGRGVPKRPIMPSQRKGLEIAIEITDQYIDERIRQSGLR